MSRYLIARLISTIPVVIGVSIIIFAMVRMIPGDPARLMLGEGATAEEIALMRKQMGYDRSIAVQYLQFVRHAVQGDLGRSTYTHRPVTADLRDRLPSTLVLTAVALVFATVIGVFGGILAAVYRHRASGFLASLATLIGISIPSFWLGLLLMIVFAVKLRIFPATGREEPLSVVLPALALGLAIAAVVARMMRSSLLEVLGQDFVRTARAKGLLERRVLFGHALKSALLPTVTIVGIEAGALIGGAVVIESVFAWPGIGQYLLNAVTYRDYPAIQGTVLLSALAFIAANLAVDLLYAWLDPRIRLA